MKWRCNTCGVRVKGAACPDCGAVLPDPATAPATDRMRRALRSVPFVLAVIVFTLALLLNVLSGLLPHRAVSADQARQAITEIERATGLTIPDDIRANFDQAIEKTTATTAPDVSDVVSAHLLSAAVCVALWLLAATGFRSGRIGRSGAVILKIVTVIELVAVCLGMGIVAAMAVFLVFGREWLLSMLIDLGAWKGLLNLFRSAISAPEYTAVVWIAAGSLLAALLIALFTLIGAIRTENEVIRVSRFGQGRKVSVFLCILLMLGAVSCFSGGGTFLLRNPLRSASALLQGLALLLFAITILRYRHWSKELLWSDVHPEAMDKAIAAIPTDLNTADLLGEPVPEAPAEAEPIGLRSAAPGLPDEPEELETPSESDAPEEPEAPKESETPAASAPADTAVDQFIASARAAAPAEAAKPASEVTTVCPHCGAVMKGKAFFCEECGQLL